MARFPDPGAEEEDPVDDAAWADMCAAQLLDKPPDWLFPEDHPPDPEDSDTWPRDPAEFDAISAQAEAEGEEDADWREALLDAGIGTGWAHYPGAPPVPGVHSGPGGGFGQGQPHDTADPEPGLAALADQAAGHDRQFTDVGDDELMGLLGAHNRLSSRQAWELLRTLAELIRRRPGPYCEPEGEARMPRVWAEGTSAEVSVQLAITRRAAAGLLALAYDLEVKLPRTSAALRDGLLDQDKAQIIVSWCANLDENQARAAEDLLFEYPDLATMTWSMIRDRIARAVMSVDPDASRKRREQGAREARVEVKLELSGNMQIAAREIPPASALALDAKLTSRAKALKKAGIKGNMNRLRMLAYLERWGIVDPFTVPGRDDGLGAGPLPRKTRTRTAQAGAPGTGTAGTRTGTPQTGTAGRGRRTGRTPTDATANAATVNPRTVNPRTTNPGAMDPETTGTDPEGTDRADADQAAGAAGGAPAATPGPGGTAGPVPSRTGSPGGST